MDNAVSIVITNYNQGKFANRAIKSVVDQSYSKDLIEIIIIDDGSTDNSVDLINEEIVKYSDNEIKNIRLVTKNNGGTASARNTGINNSNYNIIAFLDIDDEYYPNKIKYSVDTLLKYNNIGCVYSDYIEIDIDGSKKRVFKPPYNKHLLMQQCIVSTNSIITKKVVDTIGYFDESIKGPEDFDLWLRISCRFMIFHIPEPLFAYHHHGGNKSDVSDMQAWRMEEQKIRERIATGQYYVGCQSN